MRGRRLRGPVICPLVGLIPAGAGQTLQASPLGNAQRAHPRGCGADWPPATAARAYGGSSPRVRGRRFLVLPGRVDHGLIPAGAGQTSWTPDTNPSHRAHPRGCGADPPTTSRARATHGSSPRVRGRPSPDTRARVIAGLIPAGAGQTTNSWLTTGSLRAHPRGCGADFVVCAGCAVFPGSSPRVRGRLSSVITSSAGPRAHPRGCGADRCRWSLTVTSGGSSPRVRGRHLAGGLDGNFRGLIPAGAGQTGR